MGIKTHESLVTIVVNDNGLKNEKELVEFLKTKYPCIKTIVKNYNTKNTNVILSDKTEVIYGDGYIYDILCGYKFKISPLSFYQVNPIQTEILYNTAIKFATNDTNETAKTIALDLYCGIGTIGICSAKHFKKIYGIEIVKQAIDDAKENAKLNNLQNTEFYAGDVEEVLPEILEDIENKPETGSVYVKYVTEDGKVLEKESEVLVKAAIGERMEMRKLLLTGELPFMHQRIQFQRWKMQFHRQPIILRLMCNKQKMEKLF